MFDGMPAKIEEILMSNLDQVESFFKAISNLSEGESVSITILDKDGNPKVVQSFKASDIGSNKDLIQFASHIKRLKGKQLEEGLKHAKGLRKLEE